MKYFLLGLVFLTCSCGGPHRQHPFRIGVDPQWYPIDFGPQQAYVNGFTEDLLLAMAHYSGITLERLDANWDTLLDGMWEDKYDAVLTSLPPYPFHLAKYDFSHNFLDLGPILIVPVNGRQTELAQMKGEMVGLIAGDPASLLLQQYPEIIVRNFASIPDLLNAAANGDIDGALLNQVPATRYIHDMYVGRLKIASSPMTTAGLHLVTLKDKHKTFVHTFDQSIEHFKKKKKLQAMWAKWQLN